ncbi:MAG: acetyltransferase [Planctomycetes bacterium]|nr:acetyltransferase [Planctomycetota bacterium]
MVQKQKLVVFGDSAFAQIACEYFTYDSEYEVVGFTVSRDYLKQKVFCDRPVVPFEEVQEQFTPEHHRLFVALTYASMNRTRERFYDEAKSKGYTLASYISSRAFVWRNVPYGDNVFIFENNVVQPFVRIGANTILWSGNHIGHHSEVRDHCFISSHVVVSGFCDIGDHSFLGVNSTVNHNVKIGPYNLIGSGCVVTHDTQETEVYRCPKTRASMVSSLDIPL